MPGKQWSVALLEEMRRMRSRRVWTEPRPVYVAAGLVMTAGLLMLVVVSGVRQAQPVPMAPPVRQEAAAPLEPVLKAESVRPQAGPEGAADKAGTASPGEAARIMPAGAPKLPAKGPERLAFGWQISPLYGDWRYHPGVDIGLAAGSPVRAMWSGRVSDVYEDRQYGLTVAVTGGGYTVYYGSLAEARVGKNGQISAGTVVGTAGEAPGEPYPHLHLAVKSADRYVDPQELLARAQ